jgi:Arc/MetJ-type ribon-helix-helix transcriptional regulator
MAVIPVRLDPDDVRRIDTLRRRGLYRSRSEAIRELLRAQVAATLSEDEDVETLVAELVKLGRKGQAPIQLRLRRTAVEVVAEGRS